MREEKVQGNKAMREKKWNRNREGKNNGTHRKAKKIDNNYNNRKKRPNQQN